MQMPSKNIRKHATKNLILQTQTKKNSLVINATKATVSRLVYRNMCRINIRLVLDQIKTNQNLLSAVSAKIYVLTFISIMATNII